MWKQRNGWNQKMKEIKKTRINYMMEERNLVSIQIIAGLIIIPVVSLPMFFNY